MISLFTTMTEPIERGDPYFEAIASYEQIADEIVVVDGRKDPIVKDGMHEIGKQSYVHLNHKWPQEFDWKFIGEQFQRGYKACTGDWVLHADLDYIFHQNDAQHIREAFTLYKDEPALSFWKYQFIIPDRYTLKSRVVIAVNKGNFGDRIKFNGGGDQCQPTLDGKDLSPDEVPEARVPFWNYDFTFKTKEMIKKDFGRFARARAKFKGFYEWGGPDDESAFDYFMEMVKGRFEAREHKQIPLSEHPIFIQERLKGLQPNQFGWDGFGTLPRCSYV